MHFLLGLFVVCLTNCLKPIGIKKLNLKPIKKRVMAYVLKMARAWKAMAYVAILMYTVKKCFELKYGTNYDAKENQRIE